MFDATIKCVIWDLDDTLWYGTLAEKEHVAVRPELARLVRRLDAKGIVNCICSKNDYHEARTRLEDFGLWEYFVFPVIAFAPKGPAVASLLTTMQLRAQNVLVLDDNPSNRNEILFYCPGVTVADANDSGIIAALEELAENATGSSRRAQYRVLERKAKVRAEYADNAAFLEESDITVCVLRNPADLVHTDRIVELVNRSNQLNYTSSRFTDEEFESYIAGPDSVHIHHGVVFVYDRFGDYGLVGFYALDERPTKPKLDHFVFSCRVLGMGVEQAIYGYLRTTYSMKAVRSLAPVMGRTSPVRLIHALDDRLERYVAETLNPPEVYAVSIIAGCTSGVLGHYLRDVVQPARFDNFSLADDGRIAGVRAIVFTIYSDYPDAHWRGLGGFTVDRFVEYLVRFLDRHRGLQVVLILASERHGGRKRGHWTGGKRALFVRPAAALYRAAGFGRVRYRRVLRCNQLVRQIAGGYPNVAVVETGEFVRVRREQIDPLHFERVVFQRLAREIGALLRSEGANRAGASVGRSGS